MIHFNQFDLFLHHWSADNLGSVQNGPPLKWRLARRRLELAATLESRRWILVYLSTFLLKKHLNFPKQLLKRDFQLKKKNSKNEHAHRRPLTECLSAWRAASEFRTYTTLACPSAYTVYYTVQCTCKMDTFLKLALFLQVHTERTFGVSLPGQRWALQARSNASVYWTKERISLSPKESFQTGPPSEHTASGECLFSFSFVNKPGCCCFKKRLFFSLKCCSRLRCFKLSNFCLFLKRVQIICCPCVR